MNITNRTSDALRHTWQPCFGQGRAAEFLRTDCVDHLRKARKAFGVKYLRFHALFHDEMTVVTRRKDGSLCFQWQMIDRVFDTMLEIGVRPFVELNPMPSALASGSQTMFHFKMNVTPPRELSEWEQFIEAFTRHCVERYGLREVKEWYFELWNEPNLKGFWSGTQEDYFEMYRHTVQAIKGVDADLRVGGPATAQGRWIPELIAFCDQEDLALDFVSTHSYQQDELNFYPKRENSPHEPADYLLDQFKLVRKQVEESSRPDLEIHWTEWNSLSADKEGHITWTEGESTDSLYAGSFLLHHVTRSDTLCDTQSWWVISDIFGEGGISPLPYSHTYGLLTSLGIPKASFHAFTWLSRMQGPRIEVAGADSRPACGSLVTQEGEIIRALLWYHPPVENAVGEWKDSLELDLKTDCLESRAHIQEGQGSAYEAWKAWGSPPNLTPSQEEVLRYQAEPLRTIRPCDAGKCSVDFHLKPYEVLYLEWAPQERAAEARGIPSDNLQTLETELAAKSKK
jgi:xylan 1,4-beta-xylosidase